MKEYKDRYGTVYKLKVVPLGVVVEIIEEIEDERIRDMAMKLLKQYGFNGNNFNLVFHNFIEYNEALYDLENKLENAADDFNHNIKNL